MTEFKTGQKWISNAEPELGIGSIIRVEHRHVGCYFQLAGEERTYARQEAPLTRVKFNPGDEIQTLDGSLQRCKLKDANKLPLLKQAMKRACRGSGL